MILELFVEMQVLPYIINPNEHIVFLIAMIEVRSILLKSVLQFFVVSRQITICTYINEPQKTVIKFPLLMKEA